jgi:ArsR family transcriptional regulator
MTGLDLFEKRASILKAIASATRLMIIEELSAGERTVGSLTTVVDLDISTVSRHLSVLRNAGLVSSSRNGNQILYRLRVPCVLDFFDCVEKVIESDGKAECSFDETTAFRHSGESR